MTCVVTTSLLGCCDATLLRHILSYKRTAVYYYYTAAIVVVAAATATITTTTTTTTTADLVLVQLMRTELE